MSHPEFGTLHRLALFVAPALMLVGVAVAQQKPTDTNDDAAGAAQKAPAAPRRGNNAEATRQFLGLGVQPDAVAAARGKPLYAENCAGCHGTDARGGIGPNLLYSNIVLGDDHGEKLVPWLKVGRPDKGMPAFAGTPDRELTDITEFLHLQVENYANRGTYQNTNNIMTGNVAAGRAYFDRNCSNCHSAAGDMKGVGARFRPLDLQRNMIFPTREDHPQRALTAVVTGPAGTVSGTLTKIDDFELTVTDAAGVAHRIDRNDGVIVKIDDPLAWHKAFAFRLKDQDMTNLVTYLGSLK